jgi:CO/xanthine dehydrogenase FAD-binding subunit
MGTYLRPTDLPEALAALAAGVAEGRPKVVIAGATDHYPARVGRVVDEDILDASGLAGRRAIEHRDGGWLIPAGATWTDVAEAELPPLFDGLRRAARAVGGLQIQNRATIVGNVANASPAADGVPNLIALDAIVELASAGGSRRVPVAGFVTGNRSTIRTADELSTGLFVPEPPGVARSAFLKLGSRAYLVISIAMVAAVLVTDEHRRITSARVVVGACSAVAARLPELEALLVGRAAAPGLEEVVRADHVAALSPIDDVRASAAYRREAAQVLVRRALAELVA